MRTELYAIKYRVPYESNDVMGLFVYRHKAEAVCFRLNRREKYRSLQSYAAYVASWKPGLFANEMLEYSPSDCEYYVEAIRVR